MKFTIERRPFLRMIRHVRGRDPTQENPEGEIKLSACAARVFVANARMVAAYEALVFQEGECFIPGKRLIKFLRSFGGKKNLTIEVDEHGVHAGKFTSAVRAYSPVTFPPGKFEEYPVTDLNVLTTEGESTRGEGPALVPIDCERASKKRLLRSDDPLPSAMPQSTGWYSESDPDIGAARICLLQLTFFQLRPSELCRRFKLDWISACRLYDDGFLSFDPRPDRELNDAQEAEFLFVASIAAAGYDAVRLAAILHGLEWPYQYRPGRLYLDWVSRHWRLVPKIEIPEPETVFNHWLDELTEEGDTETITELAVTVTTALKSALQQKPG